MTRPRLNIDYWASLYPIYTDYAEVYDVAIDNPQLVDRAEKFWEWKGLNRSIPFETIRPEIAQLDPDDYITQNPQDAVQSLSDHLVESGVVESSSIVTAAFLLHLMASGPDTYSVTFPIYDRRVWNAYIYLWRRRGKGQQLYRQASQSTAKYEEFCRQFSRTCPDGKARDYERALFMFGGFIMKIPPTDSPTPIETIDEILERQETALTDLQSMEGHSLVDHTAIIKADQ